MCWHGLAVLTLPVLCLPLQVYVASEASLADDLDTCFGSAQGADTNDMEISFVALQVRDEAFVLSLGLVLRGCQAFEGNTYTKSACQQTHFLRCLLLFGSGSPLVFFMTQPEGDILPGKLICRFGFHDHDDLVVAIR